jgi:hypothetical protein
MDLRLEPDLAAKVEQWTAETGRPAEELVQGAIAGYFAEVGDLRELLDSRYDDIESGTVQPVEGSEAVGLLRERAAARQKSIA